MKVIFRDADQSPFDWEKVQKHLDSLDDIEEKIQYVKKVQFEYQIKNPDDYYTHPQGYQTHIPHPFLKQCEVALKHYEDQKSDESGKERDQPHNEDLRRRVMAVRFLLLGLGFEPSADESGSLAVAARFTEALFGLKSKKLTSGQVYKIWQSPYVQREALRKDDFDYVALLIAPLGLHGVMEIINRERK